jgi:hypothetical protein
MDTLLALGRRRWVQWLLSALATLALAFCLFSPTEQILEPTLDSSNYGSYAWFTAHEYRYGSEVVSMVGPLGFVPYGLFYAGHLFEERLILELITKLALGAMLVWFFRRSSPGWLRWVWLGSVALMAPAIADIPYDLASLLAGLWLLEPGPGKGLRRPDLPLTALLALLTLFKGTQTQMALLALALVLTQTVLQRDMRRAAWLLGSYTLSLVAMLLATAQNPADFPIYLKGVFELSSGYNNAMGVDEALPVLLAGAGAFGALLLLAGIPAALSWREPTKLLGFLLLAAFTFIQWKHGFVRADGHVFIFFDYVCIAAPTLWLYAFRQPATTPTPRLTSLCAGLAWAAALLGHWGTGQPFPTRHEWILREAPRRTLASWHQIVSPAKAKAELAAKLNHNRAWYELPIVKTRVGDASIDFYGTNLGFLLLNRLNYRPRPMGGGAFNVYTPWLLDRNLAAVADPASRPRFFLAQLATIDERLVAQDDSTTLRALLGLYRPVDTEQGTVLFEDTGHAGLPQPRLIERQTVALGRTIVPPSVGPHELLAVEFDLPLNLLGHARAFLYKPPMIFIDLDAEGLAQPVNRRIVPAMVSRPVPLSPVIEDNTDLVTLYTDAPGKLVRGLHLHTPTPALFASGALAVRFYAIPRPAPVSAAAPLLTRFAFRPSDWIPSEKDAPGSHLRRIGGMLVRVLDAPARIRYPLKGSENSARFIFGVDPDAYRNGHTDGVEFCVDLDRPGRPPQPLFSRLLKPATRPEDRPIQVETLVLPPHPKGSTLVLRTEIGPDNNGAWDWGFFAGVSCDTGGFVQEQFPGFGRLPSAVDAISCGKLIHEGRPVFMLNPPGYMLFELKGDESALDFQVGLLPGAYSNGGNSDGINLVVTLEREGAAPQIIHSQLINPRDRATDRGSQPVHIALPPAKSGDRLRLAIDPGPAGNDSWDWSYIENLQLK